MQIQKQSASIFVVNTKMNIILKIAEISGSNAVRSLRSGEEIFNLRLCDQRD
jgi:hypothetical protein